MSSLTVGTLNVTDKLVIPRLTAAQIAALTPEEGLIVYDTDANFVQVYVNGRWIESNVGQGNQLYDFTTYTFQPGVARGIRVAPGYQDLFAIYGSQPWAQDYFEIGSFDGYQDWTVPKSGTYDIEAGGARGGRDTNYGITDIWGARMRGKFDLTQGDVLTILVGSGGNQYGSPHGNEAGGGGASMVLNKTNGNQILIIAGGGGGSAGSPYTGSCTKDLNFGYGQTTNAVTAATCSGTYTSTTPTTGYGGWTNGPYSGCPGAGYFGGGNNDPSPWHCAAPAVGRSTALNAGAQGSNGSTCYSNGGENNRGGFGGGGGGCLGGPGGAGGYTGGCCSGGWSSYAQHGGGGGSYNIGLNQSNSRGGNSTPTPFPGGYQGAGYVKITLET